jgi:chromosomal replication initiation ATPase DnaA
MNPDHFNFIQLVERVAGEYDVSFGEIIGDSHRAPLVQARWEIYAVLRARGWSLPKIGHRMRKHHATVLYGLRRYAGASARQLAPRNYARAA